ncbi:hypothetical protein [Streptomyces geranii]|uniref:hypothetical protein n=1 Tax=Streptomyces geranii TaxID=2058923 RepID=UPI000D03AB4C|nr:hypothetical protein [Streptomyces geranii]
MKRGPTRAAAQGLDNQDKHDVLGDVTARKHWRCDDRLPLPYRLLLAVLGRVRRRDMESFRFDLFRCEG